MAGQTQSIYYGKRAYEAFARAFAAKVGVSVRIADDAGAASVDADGTIALPSMDRYQTQREFEDTCATVIHEIAHVLHGSNAVFANTIPGKSRLWRDCFNAVLDVADECGIAASETCVGNSRPRILLHNANTRAGKQKALKDAQHPLPHWQCLSYGIVRANVKAYCPGNVYQRFVDAGVNPIAVWNTLLAAKGLHRQFPDLITLTNILDDELKPLAPPDDAPDMPNPVGNGMGNRQPDGAAQRAKGRASVPKGAQEANGAQGRCFADVAYDTPTNPTQPAPGGTCPIKQPRMQTACENTRAMLMPVVKRIADRIATDGDGLLREGGWTQGTGIADAYRLATDGQAFGRWQISEHADGMAVAVLLDNSGSMTLHNPEQCAGVADAFAAGLADCAAVRCYTFGDAAREVTPCEGFSLVSADRGNTPTHMALETALAWLDTQEAGRKVIVCITDGDPDYSSLTRAQCRTAISRGVTIVGIAYTCDPYLIRNSMPGAHICAAADASRLAIELESISYQLEACAL